MDKTLHADRIDLIRRTTEFAMYIVRAYVRPGDAVIDATCGNGHDTVQLARMLGLDAAAPLPSAVDGEVCPAEGASGSTTAAGVHPAEEVSNASGYAVTKSGRLFAFDIQPQAIEATRERLCEEGFAPALTDGRIMLACLGHEHMRAFLQKTGALPGVSAIVFNLGYLPGGDKMLTTHVGTTLTAVRDAMALLRTGGLVCVTMYSGHPAGAEEKRALLAFAEGLDGKLWHVSYVSMPNQMHAPPEILLISRKG